jgi:hypothetical protein
LSYPRPTSLSAVQQGCCCVSSTPPPPPSSSIITFPHALAYAYTDHYCSTSFIITKKVRALESQLDLASSSRLDNFVLTLDNRVLTMPLLDQPTTPTRTNAKLGRAMPVSETS